MARSDRAPFQAPPLFCAAIVLQPESPGAEPPLALYRLHRTLPAAVRSLSLAMGRRDRMRAPTALAYGIVDPEGRVFSLYGARAALRGIAAPHCSVAPPVADALRRAAGFEPTGATGYSPAPRRPAPSGHQEIRA